MSLRCALVGHEPYAAAAQMGADVRYRCQRCDQPVYFWYGQKTGWYDTPETVDNQYRGVNWRRLIGVELAFVAFAGAIWWYWR